MSFRELVPGAIYDSDLETLRSVVTSGVDLNQPLDGVTPLCLAARLGRMDIVKYLLDTIKVDVDQLSEDFSVDDEVDDSSEVPWIHFEQDVINLHTHGGSSSHVTRSSCSSKPSITALNMAAKAGHVEIVELLCNQNASVKTCDQYRRTPLMHASHRGNVQLMRLLLDTGCDLHACDFQHRTALFYATHGGHNEAIQFLIQSGAQVTVTDIWGQNVLHAVTWTDHVHTAELLLGLGCDHRKEDKWRIIPGLLAVKICSSSILGCLIEHDKKFHLGWRDPESGGTLLHVAVVEENNFGASITRTLIEAGMDVNKADITGETAACLAVLYNNREALKVLIRHGCDLNIPDVPRKQPLLHAVESPRVRPDIINMLINGGAEINRRDLCDRTPLASSIVCKQGEKALTLLRNGCQVDVHDMEGMTPLHLATEQFLNDVAITLVEKGADINAPERFGWTPLHIAVDRGNIEMVEYLISAGCNVNPSETMDVRTPLNLAINRPTNNNMESIIKMLYLAGGIPSRVKTGPFNTYVAGGRRCQQILRPLLPLKLKQSCRITIRRQFKNNIISAIETLPLPRQLKNYLTHGESLVCTVARKQRKTQQPEQLASSHGALAASGSSVQEDVSPELEFPFERLT